jgi:ATP-dependent DNA helicase RecG
LTETNRIEYKRELTASLEKEVVAFLNYHEGGIIYIGIDKNGKLFGVDNPDDVQLKIKERLKHGIRPSCMGLFDVIHKKCDGNDIIQITVAAGLEKPYYLKTKGMSEKGCFLRVGSASEPMEASMIEELFSRRIRNSIGKMLSPRDDLTFEQLKIYYNESGYSLNDNFQTSLELLTHKKKSNYGAYLLADENGVSIKVAKYAGSSRVDLIENNEYGYCSLIKAVYRVLEKLEVENKTFSKITSGKRLEKRMVDPTALREAVINAVVHNDYSNGAPPKFELFNDRLEVTSMGGLPFGVTEEDFFAGISAPRNKELMRVLRDIDLIEHLGSGVPRILEKYDREVFHISANYVRITFAYEPDFGSEKTTQKSSEKGSEKTSDKIVNLMNQNREITIEEMSNKIGITDRAIEKQIANLKKNGKIDRIGADKGGHWQVNDEE